MTHLPEEHLYTHAHTWLSALAGAAGVWRVGYTKFALRMLGEIVDVQLDKVQGAGLSPGEIVGTIEGFKALSDVYSPGEGTFLRANAALQNSLEVLGENPHAEGWLYEFEGTPEPRAMKVAGYVSLLDATIDRLLERQAQSGSNHG